MPVNTPKKLEEAKSKNDPDGSSHRRVDKSPEPPLELKQPAQDSEEGPSEPPSKSKQPVQQTTKPESEDSSSFSSSSSSSESSDEEVPLKEKMKELLPSPSFKKRDRS